MCVCMMKISDLKNTQGLDYNLLGVEYLGFGVLMEKKRGKDFRNK